MYPSPFEYYRASSVDEALDLIQDHSEKKVELLAGGHSLLPTIKSGLSSPDILIDIGHIDNLKTIRESEEYITIGSMTKYTEIADQDFFWENATTIAEAAAEIGDVQVRNMGTIGGNIAHADPASDLPAAVLASNSVIHVQGLEGERQIEADDFFLSMYMTALDEEEIITAIEVPKFSENEIGSYVKKASPSSGYAIVGVAVVLQKNEETIESARVAVNGALDHATRLESVEDALTDETMTEDLIEEAASYASDGIDEFALMDDIQASDEFRLRLLEVYTQRALEKAFDRAAK